MKTITVNETTILKFVGDRIIQVQCLTSTKGTPFVRETILRKGTLEFFKAARKFQGV